MYCKLIKKLIFPNVNKMRLFHRASDHQNLLKTHIVDNPQTSHTWNNLSPKELIKNASVMDPKMIGDMGIKYKHYMKSDRLELCLLEELQVNHVLFAKYKLIFSHPMIGRCHFFIKNLIS